MIVQNFDENLCIIGEFLIGLCKNGKLVNSNK